VAPQDAERLRPAHVPGGPAARSALPRRRRRAARAGPEGAAGRAGRACRSRSERRVRRTHLRGRAALGGAVAARKASQRVAAARVERQRRGQLAGSSGHGLGGRPRAAPRLSGGLSTWLAGGIPARVLRRLSAWVPPFGARQRRAAVHARGGAPRGAPSRRWAPRRGGRERHRAAARRRRPWRRGSGATARARCAAPGWRLTSARARHAPPEPGARPTSDQHAARAQLAAPGLRLQSPGRSRSLRDRRGSACVPVASEPPRALGGHTHSRRTGTLGHARARCLAQLRARAAWSRGRAACVAAHRARRSAPGGARGRGAGSRRSGRTPRERGTSRRECRRRSAGGAPAPAPWPSRGTRARARCSHAALARPATVGRGCSRRGGPRAGLRGLRRPRRGAGQ
jgi:hypothetical protein